LKDEIKIKSFKTQEIVDTAFTVDFTQANPLTPSANKVAVIAEQKSSTLGKGSTLKGRDFRLDSVFYLDVNGKGKITSVKTSYDSYLMSEALVGGKNQVPNPDIDDVITGKRDRSITAEETLGASLRFFGAFAGVQSVDDLDILTKFVQPDTAVKFGGDPEILPFADKNIRVGRKAVVQTFTDQLLDSAPRVFDIEEIYIKDDRFIANTFEVRTAVKSGRNYDIPVSILFTAKSDNGGRVASIEGIFDSSITTTAFTGQYPFPFAA
jgi:ketosteroid isomerase-like protein